MTSHSPFFSHQKITYLFEILISYQTFFNTFHYYFYTLRSFFKVKPSMHSAITLTINHSIFNFKTKYYKHIKEFLQINTCIFSFNLVTAKRYSRQKLLLLKFLFEFHLHNNKLFRKPKQSSESFEKY